jgi:hypothetical protein
MKLLLGVLFGFPGQVLSVNASRFINSTCRDEESDCSVESTTEKEMDADASILYVT